jgi:uncharacterized protein YjbJ (UPF0337 family)
MNDRDRMIDEDRTEGSMKQTGGRMKEGAGALFGDEKLKREGQADQAEGKLQNAWGSIKDEARDLTDDRDDDIYCLNTQAERRAEAQASALFS